MKIRRDRGNTLFVVLFFIVVLSAFAGAAFNYTSGTAGVGQRSTQMTLGYGVADAAMELVYSRWRAIVQSNTTKNLNAAVFITPTAAYNSLGSDITVVSMNDLGIPSGYLGLPDTVSDPFTTAGNRAGSITIRTVDVYGRVYGNYAPYGIVGGQVEGCSDDPDKLIEATNRTGYNVTTNDYYPPPGAPTDYTFLTAIASANGFNSVNTTYEVRVNLNIPSRNGPVQVGVRRLFTRSVSSAAQAAIFFENRLEIFPGSNMRVAGRVHTNDSFYQGTPGARVLEFLKRVTYAGSDYNTNAFLTGGAALNHNIVQQGYGTLDDTGLNSTYDPALRFQGNSGAAPDLVSPMLVGAIDRSFLKPYAAVGPNQNLNLNNNSLREVIERPVRQAAAAALDPATQAYNDYWDVNLTGDAALAQAAIESARIYNQASLKIMLVYDASGHIDTTATIIRGPTPDGMADGPLIANTSALGAALLDSLNRDTGASVATRTRTLIKDARESSRGATNQVATTVLDIPSFTAAIGATSFKGILYIVDVTNQDATTLSYNNGQTTTNSNGKDYETLSGNALKHAIMLTNGAVLPGSTIADLNDPKRAFTVATENGVYIKGDYNTGATGVAVPSNVPGAPVAAVTYNAGYNPVTAAVMGDAVSVVSRNFDPTAGYDDFFKPRISTMDNTKAMAILPTSQTYVAGQTDPTTGAVIPVGPNVSYAAGTEVLPSLAGSVGAVTALTRHTVSTTVNSALVSGIFQNNATESGGGASNLLRYMENWGSVPTAYDPNTTAYGDFANMRNSRVTYRGSMMQSFYSKEFTAPWKMPNVYSAYSAPQRVVNFDESYITKPPAGFPGTIIYVKGAWERF